MKILILKSGQTVFELDLQTDIQYLIGSDTSSHIVLDDESIQPQHAYMAFNENNNLVIESLIDATDLIHNGQNLGRVELNGSDEFQIESYTFKFESKEMSASKEDVQDDFFGDLNEDSVDQNYSTKGSNSEEISTSNAEGSSEEMDMFEDFNSPPSDEENFDSTPPESEGNPSEEFEEHNVQNQNNDFDQYNSEDLFSDATPKSLNSEEQNQHLEQTEKISTEHPFSEAPASDLMNANNNYQYEMDQDQTDRIEDHIAEGESDHRVKTITNFKAIEGHDMEDPDEFTQTAHIALSLNVHVLSNRTKKPKTTFRLKGDHWVFGRSSKSDVKLDFSFLSRKHFEIINTEDGYYIKDLNSSLGTTLNNQPLSDQEYEKLYDQDLVQVKNLKLQIDLKDPRLEQMLNEYDNIEEENKRKKTQPLKPLGAHLPLNLEKKKKNSSSMNPVRLVLVLAIVFGAYMFISNPSKKKSNRKVASEAAKQKPSPKKNEVNERQEKIIQLFNIAQNYYNDRDNINCISSIERLHNLAPSYKNSKQILDLCKQGLEIEKEKEFDRKRRVQAQKIENKSNEIAQRCQKNFNNFKSKVQLESCLSELNLLNPSHPIISELITRWDVIAEEKKEKAINKKNQLAVIAKGNNLLKKAKTLQAQSKWNQAISTYQKYLSGNFPNNAENKTLAKREIASIRKKISDKLNRLLQSCQSSAQKSDNKMTIQNCQNVLKTYPYNEEALENIEVAKRKIRKKAKTVYQDAAIQESIGNISAAKEKWNQILEIDVKNGPYYKKSKRKLKRYVSD